MDRRRFLRLIPIAAAGAAVAPTLNSEVLKPKSRNPTALEAPLDTEEEYLAEVNKIVDSVNGRMKAMSEAEMQERAACSLSEYLKRYNG